MPIVLYDKERDLRLFEVSEAQLQQIVDALEEEGVGDRDYYIDAPVCDFLEGKVDAPVLAKLRAAIGAPASVAPAGDVQAAGPDEEPPPVPDAEPRGIEIEWREE